VVGGVVGAWEGVGVSGGFVGKVMIGSRAPGTQRVDPS
jgi:hypothetical protein